MSRTYLKHGKNIGNETINRLYMLQTSEWNKSHIESVQNTSNCHINYAC